MVSERLRKQDGMIRDVLKYAVLFVVILVLVLDAVAVIQVQLSVRQQATDAADVARSTYVESGRSAEAKQAAEAYLTDHDSRYISASINTTGSRDQAVVSVVAERSADTFFYKYLTHLPWVGNRVDNLLNPTVIGETDKSNI